MVHYSLIKIYFKIIITSSPPGKLTDVKGNIASKVELISTRQRFDSTAVILPTTTSPISPIYLFFFLIFLKIK